MIQVGKLMIRNIAEKLELLHQINNPTITKSQRHSDFNFLT